MKRPLIVGILIISTMPLYAQRQQQNVAKLKEDARNAVGIIGADKHKTRTYCQILELERQQADQEDNKNKSKEKNKKKNKEKKNKAEALSQKIDQLGKQLGPEFVTLDNILKDDLDLSSPDGREIASIIQSLVQSCPE
jgi:hypothetical protein